TIAVCLLRAAARATISRTASTLDTRRSGAVCPAPAGEGRQRIALESAPPAVTPQSRRRTLKQSTPTEADDARQARCPGIGAGEAELLLAHCRDDDLAVSPAANPSAGSDEHGSGGVRARGHGTALLGRVHHARQERRYDRLADNALQLHGSASRSDAVEVRSP